MKNAIRSFLLLFIILSIGWLNQVDAQDDAEECQDHPLLSRMENFIIVECESDFRAVEFFLAKETTKTIEGPMTRIDYTFQEGRTVPDPAQIKSHYTDAVQSLKGRIIYEEEWYLAAYIGWGDEKPIADNRTEEGRAKNRRIEIVWQEIT